MTQSAVAKSLRLSQAFISNVEAGLTIAPPPMAESFGRVLDYPPRFFFLSDRVYGAGPSELYHRTRQSAPTRLLKQVYALLNIERMALTRLLRSVEIPCEIPRLSVDELNTPQSIASKLRAAWRVPAGPIENLTALVEANGGIVIERRFGSPSLDGMSQWAPGTPPVFFMNAGASRSTRRQTLAHELGHIVMHSTPSATMEDEANAFAAELLMPEHEIRPHLSDLSLGQLHELKLFWRVSMAALLQRAATTQAISRDAATALWRGLGDAQHRTSEPLESELPAEEPTLLRHTVTTYRKRLGYSFDDVRHVLVLNESDFRNRYLKAPAETQLRLVRKMA